jgi:hypothetical protein
MSSLDLVDPELRVILEMAPDMGVAAGKLDTARATIAAMTAMMLEQPDPNVTTSEHHAPGGRPSGR